MGRVLDRVRCPLCGLLRPWGSYWFQQDHRVEVVRQGNPGGTGHGFTKAQSIPLQDPVIEFLSERAIQVSRRLMDRVTEWTYAARNLVAEARAILETMTGERWLPESRVREIRQEAYEEGFKDGRAGRIKGSLRPSSTPTSVTVDSIAPKEVTT